MCVDVAGRPPILISQRSDRRSHVPYTSHLRFTLFRILRSPKGWTGPAEVDGVKVTGTWRSHQVPLSGVRESTEADDTKISADGRVMEVLSEHNCHGWLEGYTLTGRHGMFATYEAFAMVSASQTVQHSKWLEEAAPLCWRARIPS